MLKNIKQFLQNSLRRPPKLAFLHVPKTGGTYLAQRETSHLPVLPVNYLGHKYVVDHESVINPIYYPHSPEHYRQTISLQEIKQYEVLSTVRNVFSWLVSYAWHAGGWNPKYRNPDHYDYDAASKGFEYLLNSIVNRDDYWPNRKFIHLQFFCNNGELIVDWINRNDTLDEDLALLAKKNKLPFTPQAKQRVGHETDYRTYYPDKLANLVYETWGRELDLFGYEFDGPKKESSGLYLAVDSETKKNIRYDLTSDVLVVDGKIIPR